MPTITFPETIPAGTAFSSDGWPAVGLYFTRGLPGSGKTTWAKYWAALDRVGRVRVNRDDLRSMVHGGEHISGRDGTEPHIVAGRDALIMTFLRRGRSVIVDDTNLPQGSVRDLAKLAAKARVPLVCVDFTDVPLGTCIERDAQRTGRAQLGEDKIRSIHDKFLEGRPHPLPLPAAPAPAPDLYEPKPGTPKAVIVDIDGTAALMGDRNPYDETRVGEDLPNLPVIQVVRALHAAGNLVVVMSGRTDGCFTETKTWLDHHLGVPFFGPYMRAEGDTRRDSVVKTELFDRYIREAFDVQCVLDDRDQVVQAWRAMGLTVLQVAPGDF